MFDKVNNRNAFRDCFWFLIFLIERDHIRQLTDEILIKHYLLFLGSHGTAEIQIRYIVCNEFVMFVMKCRTINTCSLSD